MTLLLFISVLSRYLFNYSFHWIDAFSRYSLVWITFLGSAIALRERKHIGIDNLINMMSEKFKKWVVKGGALLILIFSYNMFTQGLKLVKVTSRQVIPEMGIKMSNIYIIIPVSAVLFILVAVEIILSNDNSSLTTVEGGENE